MVGSLYSDAVESGLRALGAGGRYAGWMTGLLGVLLFLLPLTSPFGEATATASSVDNGLRLEVSVEVAGSPVAVVVRGLAAGNVELEPVALADRGNGMWQGIVELPRIENIRLGFESIPTRGPATLSELHTLIELGVDSAIFSIEREPVRFGEDSDPLANPQGQRWGWLGLAAGAGALMLIAVWSIDSWKSKPDEEADEAEQSVTADEAENHIVD